jgi:hypothetical protein
MNHYCTFLYSTKKYRVEFGARSLAVAVFHVKMSERNWWATLLLVMGWNAVPVQFFDGCNKGHYFPF